MNSERLPTLLSLLPEEEQAQGRKLPLYMQLARRIRLSSTDEKTEQVALSIQVYGLQDTEVYLEPRPISKLDLNIDLSE